MHFIKMLLASLALSFSATLPATADPAQADATVMVFWAEWCPACKILDPVLAQAVRDYEQDVTVVRLDFTDLGFDNLKAQLASAEKFGGGDFIPVINRKTGYGLIIIAGENRGRISAGMDAGLIHQALDQAFATSATAPLVE